MGAPSQRPQGGCPDWVPGLAVQTDPSAPTGKRTQAPEHTVNTGAGDLTCIGDDVTPFPALQGLRKVTRGCYSRLSPVCSWLPEDAPSPREGAEQAFWSVTSTPDGDR